MKYIARILLLEVIAFFMACGINVAAYNSNGPSWDGPPPLFTWQAFAFAHLVILGGFIFLVILVGLCMFAFPEKPESQQIGVTMIKKKSK